MQLKEKYAKLEEKRNALRQAVKLLEQQIDKIQTENLNLKQGNIIVYYVVSPVKCCKGSIRSCLFVSCRMCQVKNYVRPVKMAS